MGTTIMDLNCNENLWKVGNSLDKYEGLLKENRINIGNLIGFRLDNSVIGKWQAIKIKALLN